MYLLTDTYRILTKRLYIHVTFACGNFIGRFTKPLRAPDSQCPPGTSRERKIWNIDSSLRNFSGIHCLSHYSIQQSNFQDHTHLCTHTRAHAGSTGARRFSIIGSEESARARLCGVIQPQDPPRTPAGAAAAPWSREQRRGSARS